MDQDSFCQELFVDNESLVIKLNPAFQSGTTGMNPHSELMVVVRKKGNRSLISRFQTSALYVVIE